MPQKPEQASYQLLSSEQEENLNCITDARQQRVTYLLQSRQWLSKQPFAILLGFIILVTTSFLALTFYILTYRPTNDECVRQLSIWSPALDAVEYVETDFDIAFNSKSIYRGPPTPELEDGWHKLTHQREIKFPEDKLAQLNRSGEESSKHVYGEVGAGYWTLLEVFHQLHCLNTLRQYTWLLAGKYHDNPPLTLSSSDVGNRMHVDHCIENLRIALMCYSDVTPFLARLDEQAPLGFKPDFSSHRKCRNFDKIEQWADENDLSN